MKTERREFLSGLGQAGALLAAGPWLRAIGYAQAGRGPARVAIRRARDRDDFDRLTTAMDEVCEPWRR